jgi:hypothetical protein
MIASGGVSGKLCSGAGDFRVAQGEHFDRALECPLLAHSGHSQDVDQCPLLGVKRTSATAAWAESSSARGLYSIPNKYDY